MRKTEVIWFSLFCLLLIIYNLLFFSMNGTSDWISYSSIVFSFLVLVSVFFLGETQKKLEVLRTTIVSIAAVYFFVEFIICLIFALVGINKWQVTLVVHIVIHLFFIVVLLVNFIANEKDKVEFTRSQNGINNIRLMINKLVPLYKAMPFGEDKRRIEELVDALRSSEVTSDISVRDIEQKINLELDRIIQFIPIQDHASIKKESVYLMQLINERNQKLKSVY